MKTKINYLTFIFLLMIITVLACNQPKNPIVENSLTPSTSEFKDSTSFVKGVKVFVKPLTQIKVIENVTSQRDKHYYLIGGKQYEAKDLQSID